MREVSTEAKEFAGRFVAPCCWKESLAEHRSPEADQLRADIERRLRQGETAKAIENDLVAQYGERIFRVPRGGAGQTLFTVPLVALGLGGGALAWFLARRRAVAAAAAGTAVEPQNLPEFEEEE